MTRTRKLRRQFIAEKYKPLIDALYSDVDHIKVEAKVTYEDGRTGTVRADVRIRDVEPAEAAGAGR
jgi:long-chain acyl-CoA synthetase